MTFTFVSYGFVSNGQSISVPQSAWVWIIALVIFSTLIAFFAYFEALQEISANMASVLLLLQVLVPTTIDYFLLDLRYNVWEIAGSIFIVVAMIIVVIIPYIENTEQTLDAKDGILASE